MNVANLFAEIPADLADELFESLVETSAFKLERIVSPGQTTPRDTWYDQERDEWVILLSGSAGLLVEGEAEPLVLSPGDYVFLRAHQRHRIEWVEDRTVWLALHYGE
jgi:cupin 2 domain-containing protein